MFGMEAAVYDGYNERLFYQIKVEMFQTFHIFGILEFYKLFSGLNIFCQEYIYSGTAHKYKFEVVLYRSLWLLCFYATSARSDLLVFMGLFVSEENLKHITCVFSDATTVTL